MKHQFIKTILCGETFWLYAARPFFNVPQGKGKISFLLTNTIF